MSQKFDLEAVLHTLGWSQAELSRRVEVHANTVSGWATDRTKLPGSVKAYLVLAMKVRGLLD
jgi:hypothetical protein